MPVNVPDNPKVYTTKYTNFKGVDYTNDPSNVWYRRSPNGLNMLPDLDGRPYKRNGWKIEFTAQDFITVFLAKTSVYSNSSLYAVGEYCKYSSKLYRCNTAIETAEEFQPMHWTEISGIDQYKVDYFELGGKEYLFFHTSIGCFYYVDELTFIDKSYEKEEANYYSKTQLYDVGDYCEYTVNYLLKRFKCNTKIEVPETFNSSKWDEVTEDDCWKSFPPTGADIDYRKAFFFEGGGRAAYYLFAGGKMYWFDGTRLNEAHPTIPTVLTLCKPNGAGTLLYDVNMLTKWRAVDYKCDGESTAYTVPNGFETKVINGVEYPVGIFNVYLTDANGNWVVTYDWTATSGVVTFINGVVPQETITAQPNLKIIYRPSGLELATQKQAESAVGEISCKRTITTRRGGLRFEDDNHFTAYGAETTMQDVYESNSSATVDLENLSTPNSVQAVVQIDKDSPYYVGMPDTVLADVNSYGTNATIHFGASATVKDMFDNYPNAKETSTNVETWYERTNDTSFMGNIWTTRPVHPEYYYKKTTTIKKYNAKVTYVQNIYEESPNRNAFLSASKALVYGNGIINQVFITASSAPKYNTRVWYSMATDPLYFPDRNYIEVGATDKRIMGLIKVGDYLGIIKQGGATDTSIYLAYPTSFEDITTYAVKQSVNGIGAVSNGAFNILNDESLFLSADGVMGIEPSQDEEKKIRNRSYYVNKKLSGEGNLASAFSFVYKNMYWLGLNNRVYVLDGSQKSSWENEKTNLQYECYYLENVPAKCFAKKDGLLWFIDRSGNVCRFKGDSEELRYVDEYTVVEAGDDAWHSDVAPTEEDGELVFDKDDIYYIKEIRGTHNIKPTTTTSAEILEDLYENGFETNIGKSTELKDVSVCLQGLYGYEITPNVIRTPEYTTETVGENVFMSIESGDSAFDPPPAPISPTSQVDVDRCYAVEIQWATKNKTPISWGEMELKTVFYGGVAYSVTSVNEETVTVVKGAPIKAVWGTIADDDGSAHYYKSLQKKGSVVALMPMSNNGVKVYVIPDEKDRIFVGETTAGNHVLPFNYYLRKKVKKYKRLQIVCENDTYDCGFGIDEIIKSYIVGNYAKK